MLAGRLYWETSGVRSAVLRAASYVHLDFRSCKCICKRSLFLVAGLAADRPTEATPV